MTRATPTTNRRRVVAGVAALGLCVASCCDHSDDAGAVSGSGGGLGSGAEEVTGPTIPDDVDAILASSAEAMGKVESVAFRLVRSGAPVFLDPADSISVEVVAGQVVVDEAAAAVIEVRVDDSLNTELGAVAVDDEVLLTNPITGRYEPLPTGIDIDPSMFFDPDDGWRPLMADLVDARSLGIEQRDGTDRYHVTGTAPAERIETITAGLVTGQDVPIDFWIHPTTGLVTAAEFTTSFDDADVGWSLELFDHGRDFEISVPDELRGDS